MSARPYNEDELRYMLWVVERRRRSAEAAIVNAVQWVKAGGNPVQAINELSLFLAENPEDDLPPGDDRGEVLRWINDLTVSLEDATPPAIPALRLVSAYTQETER